MCNIFIKCFVLFSFVKCFGWNFNAMGAAAALGYMAAAAAALGYTCIAAAVDTGLCHLIGSISSDVICWTRSIRFCQS